jgi:hypothetical protein
MPWGWLAIKDGVDTLNMNDGATQGFNSGMVFSQETYFISLFHNLQ